MQFYMDNEENEEKKNKYTSHSIVCIESKKEITHPYLVCEALILIFLLTLVFSSSNNKLHHHKRNCHHTLVI